MISHFSSRQNLFKLWVKNSHIPCMSFTWQSKQTFIEYYLTTILSRSYHSEFIVNLLEFQKTHRNYQKKSTEISSFFLFIVNSRLGPIRQWISKCCIESRYETMLETCKYYHIRTHIICMHLLLLPTKFTLSIMALTLKKLMKSTS